MSNIFIEQFYYSWSTEGRTHQKWKSIEAVAQPPHCHHSTKDPLTLLLLELDWKTWRWSQLSRERPRCSLSHLRLRLWRALQSQLHTRKRKEGEARTCLQETFLSFVLTDTDPSTCPLFHGSISKDDLINLVRPWSQCAMFISFNNKKCEVWCYVWTDSRPAPSPTLSIRYCGFSCLAPGIGLACHRSCSISKDWSIWVLLPETCDVPGMGLHGINKQETRSQYVFDNF